MASLIAAHTAVWLAACSRLQSGFEDAVADARTRGWTIAAEPPARAGWPAAAGLDVPEIRVSGGEADLQGGLEWTAADIAIRLPLLHPATLEIASFGRQTLRLGTLPDITIQARPLLATVALDGATPPILTASRLAVASAWGGLTAERTVLHVADAAAMLEAHAIALPDARAWTMQSDIDTLSVRAVLTRPIPAGITPMARAEAWRRTGGTVEFSDFTLLCRALGITGHGALRLDAGLQPEFDGVADVTGYRAALDDLARSGALPSRSVMAARAVLDLLAAPAPNGPLSLPVQIRDGLLVVARFPLLRVPGVVWGVP